MKTNTHIPLPKEEHEYFTCEMGRDEMRDLIDNISSFDDFIDLLDEVQGEAEPNKPSYLIIKVLG